MKPTTKLCHAVIYFPCFAAQAHAISQPDLKKQSFVLTHPEQSRGRQKIIGVCPKAQALGIYPGMEFEKIKQRHSKIIEVPYQADIIEQAKFKLDRESEDYTPIHSFHHNSLHLNLSGTQRIYHHNLNNWWRKFSPILSDYTFFRTATAPSYITAYLIARSGLYGNWINCHRGEENNLLNPIPLYYLKNISQATHKLLRELNLQTIGDLKSLDTNFLKQFFPSDGVLLSKWLK